MKNALTLLFCFNIALLFAQTTILREDFTNEVFPPAGWTFDSREDNWERADSRIAGGTTQGEARLKGYPKFSGTTRIISPKIDLTGIDQVILEFKNTAYYPAKSAGIEVIGVGTRTSDGKWASSIRFFKRDIIEQTDRTLISVPAGDRTEFQFCLYFAGKSSNIDWYIDDIHLYKAPIHDVKTVEVNGPSVYRPNDQARFSARVRNNGKKAESFNVLCRVYDQDQTLLFTDTTRLDNLSPSKVATAPFKPFTLSRPNALYKVNISSLLSQDEKTDDNTYTKYVYTYTTPRDQVLVEMGTATWCYACPGGARGVDDLISHGHHAAVIEYHNSDDFSTPEGEFRISYYNISGIPTAIFDGDDPIVGGNSAHSLYNEYLRKYKENASVMTGVTLRLDAQIEDQDYAVTVDLQKVGPIADTNLVLFLVLTESDIDFKWQNQEKLNFVQRLLLPDKRGLSVDLAHHTSVKNTFKLHLKKDWDIDHLKLIAFVQNKDTKEVLNTSKALLSKLLGTEEKAIAQKSSFSITPNPVVDFASIRVHAPTKKHLTASVSDITGRLRLFRQLSLPTKATFSERLDLSGLAPGPYILRLKSGHQTHTQIIMKE